ncbi:hypothetical protein BT96DRAFT_587112, partial [Gymnopus androsaceus JB14]
MTDHCSNPNLGFNRQIWLVYLLLLTVLTVYACEFEPAYKYINSCAIAFHLP